MSVKVRVKRGKLYLDIYQGGKRTWETLHLELTKDKVQNKEIMRLAEICRSKRETQFLTGAWDINDPIARKMSLIKYMEEYSKGYKRTDVIVSCIKHIKEFNGGNIQLNQITTKFIFDFQNFLLSKKELSQGTAAFYSRVLRSILNRAVASGLLQKNPSNFVQRLTAPEPDMVFLSFDELNALAKVKADGRYGSEVRRAFLFACYTGLRVSDLETLTWEKITDNPMQLIKRQEKTGNPVNVPLHPNAKALITDGKKHSATDLVFDLTEIRNRRTSYRYLNDWALEAGIKKTVGWHTARRTFATLALENGADIITVAKLLGHTGLKSVTKYAKVTDKLKVEAINALPAIGV